MDNVCCKFARIMFESYLMVFSGAVYTKWIYYIAPGLIILLAEVIIGTIKDDIIGLFFLVCFIIAQPHMIYELMKYKGVTQSNALWHWQSFLIWSIYAIWRLINNIKIKGDKNKENEDLLFGFKYKNEINYSNSPLLFIVTILTIIVVLINEILDLISVYKWWIVKDRVIIRPNIILKYYHNRNQLCDKTENEEWLMKKGIEITNKHKKNLDIVNDASNNV